MGDLRPAIVMLMLFTVICGGIYPALVTAIAQALFPHQARGSFITGKGGRNVGSSLIGQPFTAPEYFWPRPSATANGPYNPAGSGGSNAGPTKPAYIATVGERVEDLRSAGLSGPIPADLVLASASGLDPHITPDGARVQVPRVARARHLPEEAVQKIVAAHTEDRQLGFLGAPRVNVLRLNLALDSLK